MVTARDGEFEGRGEGVPYARYGESMTGALEAIASLTARAAPAARVTRCSAAMPPGAARNAVDCALVGSRGAAGRRAGVGTGWPALRRDSVETAYTIVLDGAAAMAAAARRNAVPTAPQAEARRCAGRGRRTAARRPRCGARPPPHRRCERGLEHGRIGTDRPGRGGRGRRTHRAAVVRRMGTTPSRASCRRSRSARTRACAAKPDLAELAGKYQVLNIKLDKTGGLTAGPRTSCGTRMRWVSMS